MDNSVKIIKPGALVPGSENKWYVKVQLKDGTIPKNDWVFDAGSGTVTSPGGNVLKPVRDFQQPLRPAAPPAPGEGRPAASPSPAAPPAPGEGRPAASPSSAAPPAPGEGRPAASPSPAAPPAPGEVRPGADINRNGIPDEIEVQNNPLGDWDKDGIENVYDRHPRKANPRRVDDKRFPENKKPEVAGSEGEGGGASSSVSSAGTTGKLEADTNSDGRVSWQEALASRSEGMNKQFGLSGDTLQPHPRPPVDGRPSTAPAGSQISADGKLEADTNNDGRVNWQEALAARSEGMNKQFGLSGDTLQPHPRPPVDGSPSTVPVSGHTSPDKPILGADGSQISANATFDPQSERFANRRAAGTGDDATPEIYKGGAKPTDESFSFTDKIGRENTVTITESGAVIQQVEGGNPYRVTDPADIKILEDELKVKLSGPASSVVNPPNITDAQRKGDEVMGMGPDPVPTGSPGVRSTADTLSNQVTLPSTVKTDVPNPLPALDTNSGSCFPAGSMVATPSGSRPIESLAEGDEVNIWNLHEAKLGQSKITKKLTHQDEQTIIIETALGNVETTNEHRFWTGHDWVPAGKLKVGNQLFDFEGNLRQVTNIAPGEKKDVYNFHVDSPEHNYFVEGFLVHNMKMLE